MDAVHVPDPSPLLTPRVAGLLLGLLLGCVLAIAAYLASVVVLGTSEAGGSAIALACQTAWQALVVRWTFGGFRRAWLAHVACGVVAFGLAGLSGLSGGSAFFAVAGVAFVVMPVGALACAWRARTAL